MRTLILKNLGEVIKPELQHCIQTHILDTRGRLNNPQEVAKNLLIALRDKIKVTVENAKKQPELFAYMRKEFNQKYPGKETVYIANFLFLRVINFLIIKPEQLNLSYPPAVPPEEVSSETKAASELTKVLINIVQVKAAPEECLQDPLGGMIKEIIALVDSIL